MIYVLHIDPPFHHARHYVGWTKDGNVEKRVREHITQTGSHPSKLIGAALAAGRTVTLAGTLPGDRTEERRLKNLGGASRYCPRCNSGYKRRNGRGQEVTP